MVFKINLGDKGKTFKVETDNEGLIGKKIGDKIEGKELSGSLEGYEVEVRGTSDKAGFAGSEDIEGFALKRVLLTKGKFMKGWKKRRKKSIKIKGLRLKKTLRGREISKDTIQINTIVVKHGHKKLEEIFPEQNQPKAKVENKEEVKK